MLVYPWYLFVIRTWRQVDSTKFSEVFLLKFYNILVDLSYRGFFIGSMKTKRGGSITPKFANTFPSGKSWCYGVATACYVQDQRKLQPDCIVQWHNSVPQHFPSIAFIRTRQFFLRSRIPQSSSNNTVLRQSNHKNKHLEGLQDPNSPRLPKQLLLLGLAMILVNFLGLLGHVPHVGCFSCLGAQKCCIAFVKLIEMRKTLHCPDEN